jgi:hypothetical protein
MADWRLGSAVDIARNIAGFRSRSQGSEQKWAAATARQNIGLRDGRRGLRHKKRA